ncbi:protein ENHANCED DISEASE RESISTANCE 4 [Salvia divinorum]|uniref:Protein ENHANCED DISEASE RESISTANCE 4 n=1 Tax=Salvia divinorum TaxID=28513 RepID=A0ABD1GD38_SALDI
MTTQGNVQIRFVKCPRCRKILPELPELPMYKCGGCGITLLAKHRNPETNHTELPSQETDPAEGGQQGSVSGETEGRSSSADLTDSPKVESSPDEGERKRQDDFDSSVELSHTRDASDSLSGSPDTTSPQSEGLSSDVRASFINNISAERYRGKPEDEHVDSVKLSHNRDTSDSLSGSPDTTSPQSEGLSSEVRASFINNRSAERYRGKSEDEHGDSVELSHNRDDSGSLSASHDITSPRSEGFSSEVRQSFRNNPLDRSPERYRGKSEDEHGDSVEVSRERGASDGLSACETSPVEVQESSEKTPLGRSPQKCRSNSDDHEEWTASSNSLDGLPSSGEISLEAEACTREASEHVEQMKDGESEQVWPKGDDLVDEVQKLPEYEDQESGLPERIEENNALAENEGTTRTFLTDQNRESSDEIKHVGPTMISHEISITSPSAEVVGDGSRDLPVSRNPSSERSTSPKASAPVHAPRSPSRGSLVSFYLTTDDEQLDGSPREVARTFERFNSTDTLGSSHLGDHSSELNFRHGPATFHQNSKSYYAYDGSESSYDGIDDQVRERFSQPSRKANDVGHVRAREKPRNGGFSGNNAVKSEAERAYRATSPSSREMHIPWNRGQNRMRLDPQGDVSRAPFPSRDHTAGRRPAGIPVHRHNLLPPHPPSNLPEKFSYSDPEKIDLLRTVHHLKDQLERMQFNALPYLSAEREMYAGVSHSGPCNRRNDRAKGYGERYERRMAFSGEAAHFRHQASCSCLHCSQQDWQYRKNGHRAIHADHNCCGSSNSSSPHRYASSEPSSWGRETKPDNQRLDEIRRSQLREKYSVAKRHLRPIAGGAPVITCYHCSQLLQLPVDFLLFKKRYHQLMCNACQKVMKFSVLKGNHLVPYVTDTRAPPPSEAGDYNRRNLEPAPQSITCQHVESVSYSDEYGRSFCRSCSTEGEVSAAFPSIDRAKGDSYDRKMSSGGGYYEDRKLKGVSKEGVESAGPSSSTATWRNATTSVSEIEELPPLSNSPLHRLMGYSTPSKVFKRG